MDGEGAADGPARLGLEVVAGADDDPERVEALTYQLRQELLELDVDAVELPSAGDAPPGTKSPDALAVGQLIVELAVPLLPAVLGVVQAWLSRQGAQRVRLRLGEDEIEIHGKLSADERARLIGAFADRR